MLPAQEELLSHNWMGRETLLMNNWFVKIHSLSLRPARNHWPALCACPNGSLANSLTVQGVEGSSGERSAFKALAELSPSQQLPSRAPHICVCLNRCLAHI